MQPARTWHPARTAVAMSVLLALAISGLVVLAPHTPSKPSKLAFSRPAPLAGQTVRPRLSLSRPRLAIKVRAPRRPGTYKG